jgi:hypothetical protein
MKDPAALRLFDAFCATLLVILSARKADVTIVISHGQYSAVTDFISRFTD